jgi:hypothetical protein
MRPINHYRFCQHLNYTRPKSIKQQRSPVIVSPIDNGNGNEQPLYGYEQAGKGDGYTKAFKVTARVCASRCLERRTAPAAVQGINFYRFEGESDPADNYIMSPD